MLLCCKSIKHKVISESLVFSEDNLGSIRSAGSAHPTIIDQLSGTLRTDSENVIGVSMKLVCFAARDHVTGQEIGKHSRYFHTKRLWTHHSGW